MQSKEKRKGGCARKLFQLCRQVERALSYAFAGSADPVLQELDLVSVRPAPDASRLSVLLAVSGAPSREALEQIGRRLDAASGWLRGEVGRSISRRRVPLLIYRVRPDQVSA